MVSIKYLRDETALVEALRKQVDLRPYRPVPGAPAWVDGLADFAGHDGGVLAVLGPGGVRTTVIDEASARQRKARAVPDPSTVLLAGLAARVRATGEKLALGVPPAARHLPLLLASAAVMADTIASQAGALALVKQGVLVVSPDLDLRSRYCDLFIGEDLRLNDLKAGARMTRTGERVLLPMSRQATKTAGRRSASLPSVPRAEGGVCFFLPLLELPTEIDQQPALVILDLRFGRWVARAADLANWATDVCGGAGVIALYSIGDFDTLDAVRASGYADLPFDHDAVAVCNSVMEQDLDATTGTLDWSLSNAQQYLYREHEIRGIAGAEELELQFEAVGAVLNEHRNADSLDLNRARWLLAAMMQMSAPIDYYERAAIEAGRSRMGRLIERLGVTRAWEGDSGLDAVVQSVRVELRGMYETIRRCNPRAEMLRGVLTEVAHAAGDGRVLVLVRDRTMERATRTWLLLTAFPEASWMDRVDVVACPEYARLAGVKYDVAIVNGAIPRRYRWIAGAALAKCVVFLGYEHEHNVIERQLTEMYGADARRQRAELRSMVICGATTAESAVPAHIAGGVPPLALRRPPSRPLLDRSKPDGVRVLASLDALAEAMEIALRPASDTGFGLADAGVDDEPPGDATTALDDPADGEHVPALRLDVETRMRGLGTIWLPRDGMAEIVRPEQEGDVLRMPVEEVREGDVVVCMDADGRLGLFDRMAALAAEQPEMAYLTTVRQLWLDALEALVLRFRGSTKRVDRSAMLEALKAAEPRFRVRSELTLYLWARDEVIGPEDEASITAVGKVLESPRIVKLAPELHRAFRQIRGIRQGIGRRLSGLIRRAFHLAATDAARDDTGLDERLLLPLDELLESVDLARVLAIAESADVPSAWLRRWRPV